MIDPSIKTTSTNSKSPRWRVRVFNVIFLIQDEPFKAPNWFWRKMQYLAFGVKWERVQ